MTSRRLPGKVLKNLAGEPMLARVVERVRQARSLGFVGVATSNQSDDDPIATFCREHGIPVYRGPLDDVLTRTAGAAAEWGLDPVVRITADCPFVCPELIDRLVARLGLEDADAVRLAGPSLHEGIDPFSRRALEHWQGMSLPSEEREHLALLPDRRGADLRIVQLEPSPDDPPPGPVRLSVDEPSQMAFARATYAALGGHARFTTKELLQQLAASTSPTGADAVAEGLLEAGVPRLHLYPGGTIMPMLNAWIARGGEFVVARHEQGAGYAALAEARLTGEPRVVMVTSGPGVTNLITVLADAWYDSTPLIALTGQVGTGDLQSRPGVRQRGFQEVPTSALCAPISKACLRPMEASEVPSAIAEALATARAGRPGPVVVELPMDVQRAPLGKSVRTPDAPARRPALLEPEADAMGLLAEWLSEAERPLVLAGQGVLQAGATSALLRIAERAQIPVATSLLGVGAIPGDHPLALGMTGHTGTGWANRAMAECDLLLVLGARLDVRQTGTRTEDFAHRARIVRIDTDESELAEPRVHCALPIHADVGAALAALEACWNPESQPTAQREPWLHQLKEWRATLPLDGASALSGCHPAEVLRALDHATAGEALVAITGVGHHQQWAARHLTFDAPRRTLLTSGGHGAMGFDLPSAIGACLARPEARVLVVVGDGSFQINGQELGTLAEYQLPAKIVVLDNRRLAMVSQFQKITWGHDPSTGDCAAVDFAGLAQSYGLAAFRLEEWNPAGRETLEAFLAGPGPALLWVSIDPRCDVSPMLLADRTTDDLWYGDEE
ncbi:MAG: NTP transferase domain-containing protein [bacterium]|nr:NTP transferase domain-containing protein [bacterium]MCP5068566.1 NTP transferase domain-containing protein [bacterium]